LLLPFAFQFCCNEGVSSPHASKICCTAITATKKKIPTDQEPALILTITAIVHRKLMEELIISEVFDASCRQ
jgi:hypothetical protein